MATDPRQFNNKEFQKEFQETVSVLKDTLVGLSASMSQAMTEAMAGANNEIEKKTIKLVKSDLASAFKAVASEADKIAETNNKFIKGQQTVAQLQRKRADSEEKFARLERARNEALRYGVELTGEQLADYEAAKQEVENIGKQQEDAAKKLERKLGGLVGIFDRVSKIPIAGELLNAGAASEAMKKELIESGDSLKAFGKGVGAAFAGIEKGTVILFLINQAVKVFRFFKDLAFGVSEQIASLAKGLGTSLETGRGLQASFYEIQKTTTNLVYNVRTLGQAAIELAENFGYARIASQDILKTQVLLTQRVGSSATAAANLNMLFKATGQNTEAAFEHMNQLGIRLQEIDGIGVNVKTVIEDISAAGAEVASYFGFSTTALAEAVINARKLGLNISQAKSVAKGLLDFENSISAQLELSVLTQKQFNFGNAMAKAAMGDIAGATQDVIKQMNQLTTEQRKSPIILEAMSKATGLSTDELAKQYALQYDINAQKEEYGRILEKEGRAAARTYLVEKGIALAEVKDIEDRISASERFNQALDAAKDAFGRLVSGGMLDRMIMSLEKVIEKLEWLFGIDASDKYEMEKKRIEAYGTDEEKELLRKSEKEFREKIEPKQTQADEEFKLGLESMRYSGTKDYAFKAAGKKVIDVEGQTRQFHREQLEALESLRQEMAKKQVMKVNGNNLTATTSTHKNTKLPQSVPFGGL